MKKNKLIKVILIILMIILILYFAEITYSRYTITKKKEVTINTSATLNSGTVDFTITNEKNIYTVKEQTDKISISSTIKLDNKDNIQLKAYYAWTSINSEPENYTEFELTKNIENISNTYTITKTDNLIGTYYLWVKVEYTSEIGEKKEIVKSSRAINVVLGDIEINLEDEESEYLSGDVKVRISYKGNYTYNAKSGYGKTEEEARANATEENKNEIIIRMEEIENTYYVYAEAEDESANKIYVVREINNIDNIKPKIEVVTPSFARVWVKLTDSKSGIKAYTVTASNTQPTEYTYELVTTSRMVENYIDGLNQNTTYYLWVKDGVGNVTSTEFSTKKVNYEITPDLKTLTNGDTKITFLNLGNSSVTYNFNGGTNYTYNNETGIIVSENIRINYELKDGNNTITGSIEITNIDKVAPSIITKTDYEKILIEATDEETGVVGYFVTDTVPTDITKVAFTTCKKTKNFSKSITQDYLGNDLIYNKLYYIYVKDECGNIAVSEAISKIDKIKPSIELKEKSSTTNSITVTVTAEDNESGLDGKYKYYLSTIPGDFNNCTQENKTYVETSNFSYTFTELEDDVTYYVKVEVADLAGNINNVETSLTTNELLYIDGDIVFTKAMWKSNIQTVTTTTTTIHKMKYQIVKSGENLKLENKYWIGPIESPTQIEGLEHGDVLYVRLYDGTNISSNWATYNVINVMKQNYSSISDEQINNIKSGNFDILTYSVDNEKIKVAASELNGDTLTYNYYIKNIKDDMYTLMMTSSSYDEQVEVQQLEVGQTYSTICIELSSGVTGELTKSKNKTVTVANEVTVPGNYNTKNATYIDSEHYTVTVAKGFTVSNKETENVISKGLVLVDQNKNEFVWIPVNNAIYDEKTTIGSNNDYTPMVRYQAKSDVYFEKIYYNFSGVSSTASLSTNYRVGGTSHKEPALITSNTLDKYTWDVLIPPYGTAYDANESYYKNILGFDYSRLFGEHLNNEYTNMVTSVDAYGGFYCGRYETTNIDGKIGAKANSPILNSLNWYNLYKYQSNILYKNNEYYGSKVLVSGMITGSQYDAVMNFILKGNDKELVTKADKLIGNKNNIIANTGLYEDDKMNNIYDLISNAYEVTSETNYINYRIYRGGGYDRTEMMRSASAKTSIIPTDSGLIMGSRMALYLLVDLLEMDITPPTFEFEVKSSSNNIEVDVTATDTGEGVKDYYYSISETGNDGEWSEEQIVTAGNKYTFENLKSETKYYIRVRVSDKAENISRYQVKSCTTGAMEIIEDVIKIGNAYGKDGEGVVYLKTNEEYFAEGYYPIYQVVHEGNEFNIEGEWKKGDTVTNLKETDIIYAKPTDGVNTIESYVVLTLKGLFETYSDIYEKTEKYIDENGEEAYIPAGFKVGTSSSVNTIENGLVIEDENENQFVWIPVKEVVNDETTTIPINATQAKVDKINYRPMVRYQKGSSRYYEGMYYTFLEGGYSYKSEFRIIEQCNYTEPRLVLANQFISEWDFENKSVKNYGDDGEAANYYKKNLRFNSTEEFGKYMNEEYTNMVNSVQKFGGFYIGRYETSVTGTTVQSKIGQIPFANELWYDYYMYTDSNRYEENPYYNSKSVVSMMQTNSQWNAMLNWIVQGKNVQKVTDTTIGNQIGNPIGGVGKIVNTGATGNDIINNIIDLAGNVSEYTQAGHDRYYRAERGGDFNSSKEGTAKNITAKVRLPDKSISSGTRMALYINDEKDTTKPIVSLRENTEPEVTTSSIYIKVYAEDVDNGSGILNYKYSISSDGGENYTDYIRYQNTFKFEGLNQNTNYIIKVTVEDHAGNISDELIIDGVMTKVLEIQEADISEFSRYGTEDLGVSCVNLSQSLKDKNYSTVYQIVHNGEKFDKNVVWLDGRQGNNLKVGDTIYIKATDKTNTSETYATIVIDELETYSENAYEVLTEYTDINGEKAWIPGGFKVGTSSLNNRVEGGLVIKNSETEDEFVWVPVKNAIYDERDGVLPTDAASANKNVDSEGNVVSYKPMAKYQKGYNWETEHYYEGILYTYNASNVKGAYARRGATDYALGQNSFREPSLVTGSTEQYTWIHKAGTTLDADSRNYKDTMKFNSATEFGIYLNDEYTKMVESVDKYGGFWVGRYEASIYNNISRSKAGLNPTSAGNFYKLYYAQDSNRNEQNLYYGNKEITTTMIWGSQWDAMLNWILEGKYADQVLYQEASGTTVGILCGKNGYDYANNILDLGSNRSERTLECDGVANHILRGGGYSLKNPAGRSSSNAEWNSSNTGTRFTFYIK